MLPFDDIPSVRAFVCIAETGSFSGAAEILHLTQPAISKRIAVLETNLSEKLFNRIGRKISLTETGQAILPKCKHILATIEDAELLLNNLDGKIEGTLKLGTSHHIGLHHLPPVIREFGQRYPQVELELHFMSSEQVCIKIQQAELDLGVVTLPISALDTLITKSLWVDDMKAVVGNNHILTSHKKVTLKTLTKFNALLPEKETYTRKIIENIFLESKLTVITKLSTNYLETIKMMVSVGLGWSVLPGSMIDKDLTVLDIPDFSLTRVLGHVQHRQRIASNASVAMMGLLNEFK